jgi:hypothetical protein
VANMHIMNKATIEVQIMCLVSYIEMCAARHKIDGDAAKSRWTSFAWWTAEGRISLIIV